jgi:two-component system, NarL family, response regulator
MGEAMETTIGKTIRVLIVDDHPVVRAGLNSMLATLKGFAVVGVAADGKEALSQIDEHQPDVVLLDLHMPGMDGIALLEHLKGKSADLRFIVLTSFDGDEEIYRAVRAGAHGYLLKDTGEAEMVHAIRSVCAGKRYIPLRIAEQLAERMMRSSLTAREVEMLPLLAKGLTNKDIGRSLDISENTARNHVNSIIEKMGVSGRTEAVTAALQQGIIRMD